MLLLCCAGAVTQNQAFYRHHRGIPSKIPKLLTTSNRKYIRNDDQEW